MGISKEQKIRLAIQSATTRIRSEINSIGAIGTRAISVGHSSGDRDIKALCSMIKDMSDQQTKSLENISKIILGCIEEIYKEDFNPSKPMISSLGPREK